MKSDVAQRTERPLGLPTFCGGALVLFALVAAVVHLTNGRLSTDRHILNWVVAHRTNTIVNIAKATSTLADPPVLGIISLLVTGALFLRFVKQKDSPVLAFVPLAALTVGTALQIALKQVFGRARPPAMYHLITESDFSFPSGHTTGAAAFFLALGLVLSPLLVNRSRRAAVLLVACLVALLVGASRVVLGVHWASDVLGGWMLGVACATGATFAAQQWELRLRRHRVTSGALDLH